MSRLGVWLEAMRLRTLPVSIAGVIAAAAWCERSDVCAWWAVLVCLLFAVTAQIASNFANEYFDYKAGRDKPGREGPRRGVTEGDITPKQMLYAIGICLVIAALLGLTLAVRGGWWLVGVGVLIGLGLFAYSTGPYPLSTHGAGEAAVLVFFGIVPVNLTYYVGTLSWSWEVFATSVAVGLMGSNVLIINNYRDIEDDRAVGKRTLAVRLGGGAMRYLYFANGVVAALLTLPTWVGSMWLAVPAVYILAVRWIVSEMSRREGHRLTPLLGITSVLMFVYSLAMLAALGL